MIKFLKDSYINKTFSAIIILAFPIIIQGIVFQLQSLIDKAFLGNLDIKYLTAMGAAQIPFNTTVDCLVALCTGITIVVSQLYGKKKGDTIVRTVRSAILCNTIISFLLLILWFCFSRYIFNLMSVDESIIDYCISYVKICSIYILFLGIDLTLQAMLQGMGDTKAIMYSGLTKVFFNVFLAWVLIYGNLGFPSLGVQGAALATTIANVTASFIMVIYCFIVKKDVYKLSKGKVSFFDISSYKNAIKLGIPTSMEFFLWNSANLVLVKFLNSISSMATTVYTLTFLCIEGFVYMIFNGFARASLTLQGHKIGQNDTDGAKKIFKASMFLNIFVVSISLLLFTIFPRQILRIFTNDIATIQQSIPFLIFAGIILVPKSINVMVGSGIRAYGDTKWMLYTQIIGSTLVVICSFVLVNVIHLNIIAIYITCFFDETIRSCFNCYHYYKGNLTNSVVTTSDEIAM